MTIREVDGYIKEENGSKYLVFDSENENREVLKKYAGIWYVVKNEIETINEGKKGEDDKDFVKIKFESDDNLPLNKTLKFHNMTIVIRSVFEQDGKIDVSERIVINKTNASKECKICHYWYFKDILFKYEPYLCNGCDGLMQKAVSFNDVVVVYIKGIAYRIHFWCMSKNDATSIMNNSNLIDKMGVL